MNYYLTKLIAEKNGRESWADVDFSFDRLAANSFVFWGFLQETDNN